METKRNIKVYLSGPVSGLPIQEARRNFEEASIQCLALITDYETVSVVNPMKLPLPYGLEWSDYMIMDLQLLKHCDAIIMLTGWEESAGARIEQEFAKASGKAVYYMDGSVTETIITNH